MRGQSFSGDRILFVFWRPALSVAQMRSRDNVLQKNTIERRPFYSVLFAFYYYYFFIKKIFPSKLFFEMTIPM